MDFRVVVSFFCCYLMMSSLLAQIPLQESGKMISQAYKLYESEKQADAITLLNEIFEGDTNYVAAQILAGRMSYESKNYEEAKRNMLSANRFPHEQMNETYNMLALAYHQLKMPDSADYYLEAGIRLFPVDPLFTANKGFVNYHRGNFELAQTATLQAIDMNPWSSNPHYFMGYLAAGQQHYSHALMAWGVYLILNNNFTILKEVEALCNGSFELNEKFKPKSAYAKNTFGSIDEKIEAKLPLNAAYKSGIKFDAALVKQYKYFIETYTYKAKSDDLYEQYYGAFYQQLKEKKLIEPFVRLMIGAMDHTENDKWLAKNQKKTKLVEDELNVLLRGIMNRQQLNIHGKMVDLECWYSRQKIEALGEAENSDLGKRKGYWYYFATNGVLTAEGEYVNYKKSGLWRYYHREGWLEYEINYADGKQNGAFFRYYKNGNKISELNFVNDMAEGDARYYFDCGALKKTVSFKADEEEGVETTYFKSGKLESTCRMQKGAYVDSGFTYYKNGGPDLKLFYINGKAHGNFERYYENGKLYSKGQYAQGKQQGDWTFYYDNGQIKSRGKFDEHEKNTGRWEYYSVTATLETVLLFEKGEKVGRQEFYDNHGRLERVVIAKAGGKYVEERYYDINGKEVAQFGHSSGNYAVKTKHDNGVVAMEGQYNKGMMDGSWRWYHKNGQLRMQAEYKEGYKWGEEKKYDYLGQLIEVNNYKNGDLDGPTIEYYPDGTLKMSGNYVNDEGQGRWEWYHENGLLRERSFLLNGRRRGVSYDFHVDGRLRLEDIYENSMDAKWQYYYDNKGKRHVYSSIAANEKYWIIPFSNGQTRIRNEVTCGEVQGQSIHKNELGDTLEVRSYQEDALQGWAYRYYHTGNLRSKEWYNQGQLDSLSVFYYPNGKIENTGNYKEGKRSGVWKHYHYNGKLDVAIAYDSHGRRQGWSTYYDYNGEILQEKHYSQGEIDSFRYLGRDNKMLPAIFVNPDSAVIVSYFSNGKIAAKEQYLDGNFHGNIIRYHADGSVMESYTLILGDYHGPFYYGYPGGKPRLVGNNLFGNWHGVITRYSAPDKVFSEIHMVCDLPLGKVVYYDLKGVKTHEHEVRDFELVETP